MLLQAQDLCNFAPSIEDLQVDARRLRTGTGRVFISRDRRRQVARRQWRSGETNPSWNGAQSLSAIATCAALPPGPAEPKTRDSRGLERTRRI